LAMQPVTLAMQPVNLPMQPVTLAMQPVTLAMQPVGLDFSAYLMVRCAGSEIGFGKVGHPQSMSPQGRCL
jgi:hypothetical protein